MLKEEIIKSVKAFARDEDLKLDEVVVGAGAALVLHGLRAQTNDVDVAVSKGHFDKILHSGRYKTHLFGATVVIECGQNVDLHENHYSGGLSVIDGITCYDLEGLLQQKLTLNRQKDQADIKAIKARIKKDQAKLKKPLYHSW